VQIQATDSSTKIVQGTGNLLGISLIAALAGFIFGFDTVVISGANQPIKDIWHTTEIHPLFHGLFIMSMALWGTVVGAVFGGIPTDKFGRKKVLLWVGILFSVSAIGSAVAPDPYTFSIFRFIGGLGIGVSSIAAPAYVTEISTPATRGRLSALYQFNIVFGILIAFLSNYFLKGVGGANDWRWMLGVMAVPSLLYTLLVMTIPESPRWLIARKNDVDTARKVFLKIGVLNAEEVIQSVRSSVQHEAAIGHGSGFFSRKYSTILWLAFMVAFFNQWSGINFILYYASEILERAGLASKESLKNSIYIGGTNLIFTFIGLSLIDKLGRSEKLILTTGASTLSKMNPQFASIYANERITTMSNEMAKIDDLKGIDMTTGPDDYQPMEELLLQRFNGERFEVFGELLSARVK